MSEIVERLRARSDDYGMDWLNGVADRIERLEAALRPFAAKADEISKGHLDGHVSDENEMYVRVLHLREARAALGEPEDD